MDLLYIKIHSNYWIIDGLLVAYTGVRNLSWGDGSWFGPRIACITWFPQLSQTQDSFPFVHLWLDRVDYFGEEIPSRNDLMDKFSITQKYLAV